MLKPDPSALPGVAKLNIVFAVTVLRPIISEDYRIVYGSRPWTVKKLIIPIYQAVVREQTGKEVVVRFLWSVAEEKNNGYFII